MRQTNRYLFGFVLLCATCLVLAPRSPVHSWSAGPSANASLDSRFSVLAQPDAPLCITLVQASWSAPRWSAKVNISNCGSKDVIAFEVDYTEDYLNARGVWSSDGKSGTPIAVGEALDFEAGGGFRDGMQNGRPVGELQCILVGLVSVTFADGSSWYKAGLHSESP